MGQHGAEINGCPSSSPGRRRRWRVANFLRAGQIEPIAQGIQQRHARFDADLSALAVDLERNGRFAGSDDIWILSCRVRQRATAVITPAGGGPDASPSKTRVARGLGKIHLIRHVRFPFFTNPAAPKTVQTRGTSL